MARQSDSRILKSGHSDAVAIFVQSCFTWMGPPLTVGAGEVFFTERGRIHNARNLGTMTAKVDTYVINKGKPGITPTQ